MMTLNGILLIWVGLLGTYSIHSPALAGETPGSSVCGPDCTAQNFFESDSRVTSAIRKLASQGFQVRIPSRDVNSFSAQLDCYKPSADATWIACDRLYVFSRTFKSESGDPSLTRTVTALVKLTTTGTELTMVNPRH